MSGFPKASGSASFATPNIALGSAAAAGVAGTVIRSDATVVAFDATAPTTETFAVAASVGAATVTARRDHTHGMPGDPNGVSVWPESGRYFTHGAPLGSSSTRLMTAAQLELWPIVLAIATNVNQIGVNCSSGGTAGSVLRFGIYADNGGIPGALLFDAGTVASATSGDKLVTVAWTLPAGRYWYGVVTQGTPVTEPTLRTHGGGSAAGDLFAATITGGNSVNVDMANTTGIRQYAGVVGALSALGAVTRAAASVLFPQIWMRAV